MGYRIAVVGATGNVGREMLNILAEREFPVDEIIALASRKSLGSEVSFGEKTLKTKDLDTFDFTGWDIALFAVGTDATKIYAPKAAKAGCVVIDNSSLYRYDPDVPLIVPEVNAKAIHGYSKKNIIANPNCSTAQMVVALKPLHDRATIKRVVVSTYQSVSGAGKGGIECTRYQRVDQDRSKGTDDRQPAGAHAKRDDQKDHARNDSAVAQKKQNELHGRKAHGETGRDQTLHRSAQPPKISLDTNNYHQHCQQSFGQNLYLHIVVQILRTIEFLLLD